MKAALTTASLTLTLLSAGCQRPDSPSAEEALQTITTKGGIEMVLIPAGTFSMGCRDGPKDASAVHQVTIASFWMDRCETTQADYERLGFPNPSHFKGPDLPVEQINWPQAATYCNARSQAEGLTACYDEATAACNFAADGYRLPTEAEWEYACRAGKPTDYSFGNDVRELDLYAWFADNSSKKTHPVGRKKPNRWGLYDMHGNVAEWCNDFYSPDYYQTSPPTDPHGPADGKLNVLRGGAWNASADRLRSCRRQGELPGFSDACLARDAIGFRCVRKAPTRRLSLDLQPSESAATRLHEWKQTPSAPARPLASPVSRKPQESGDRNQESAKIDDP